MEGGRSNQTEQICKVVYDPFSSFTIIAEVEEGFLTLFKSIILGHWWKTDKKHLDEDQNLILNEGQS